MRSAAGLKARNLPSLSATMTASPMLDRMDSRISLVLESFSSARFRSMARPNWAATAAITFTKRSFLARDSCTKNSITAMTSSPDRIGMPTAAFSPTFAAALVLGKFGSCVTSSIHAGRFNSQTRPGRPTPGLK